MILTTPSSSLSSADPNAFFELLKLTGVKSAFVFMQVAIAWALALTVVDSTALRKGPRRS